MGTSIGSAGGGSGGSGGGAGFVTISRRGVTEVDPIEAKAQSAAQGLFSKLSTDYLEHMAGDSGLVAAYEALHTLHVELVENKSWQGVEEKFRVPGGKGCLRAFMEALTRTDGVDAVHPRTQPLLRAALLTFFRRIVGGDPVVRNNGTAAEVLAALDPRPFQSTSALFLGDYLTEILRVEDAPISKLGVERRKDFALKKANQVVAAFETKFKDKKWQKVNQIGFKQFFRVLQGEPQWLAAQLRKKL